MQLWDENTSLEKLNYFKRALYMLTCEDVPAGHPIASSPHLA